MFCHKRGHFQADCRLYKSAQAKVLEKDSEEHVNTVSHFDRIEDTSSYYKPPQQQDQDYKSEYVYAVGATKDWVIDLGATRHFSGFVSDFELIKR
jgi:hypothetical protein